jgi:hypothetical protein
LVGGKVHKVNHPLDLVDVPSIPRLKTSKCENFTEKAAMQRLYISPNIKKFKMKWNVSSTVGLIRA